MLGEFLSRVIAPGSRGAELVRWSRGVNGHWAGRDEFQRPARGLVYSGIGLCVVLEFEAEATWAYVDVNNESQKALGFGAAGLGLVLKSGSHSAVLPCVTLSEHGKDCTRVFVEAGRSLSFTACFDHVPKPERAELSIQANRIFATSFLFSIPFESLP